MTNSFIINSFIVEYRLVIICSNEEEELSYFISKLHIYKRAFVVPSIVQDYKDYLASKFIRSTQEVMDPSTQADGCIPASDVDSEWYVFCL